MPDLLLELRSEEIPARLQRKAAGDLKKLLTDALVGAGLTYEGAREYWTPRRLTLDIRGLTARSADTREEKKGPRTDAPQQAIDGFLRGAGLTSIDQAEKVTDPKKGEFYVAIISKPGRAAEEIIADVMPGIIRNFPWPKPMRSGAASAKPGSLRWVRPLQSIVCMFGPEHDETQVIPFEVDGIIASNITYGHRFHAPDAIKVRRFEDYAASLERAKVVLDAERRKQIILQDARNLAFASGLDLVEDEGLLEEVSGLVEYPHVLLGSFEEDYLKIPAEIIRLTIKTNQKCFVAAKQDGSGLSNHFILVSNIEAKDGGKEIIHGNGKVVRARLSDALHFYKRDQMDIPDLGELGASAEKFDLDLTKPLDQRMAKLDHLNVTFHAKLGSQGERVTRIRALAQAIAPIVYASRSTPSSDPSDHLLPAGAKGTQEAASSAPSTLRGEGRGEGDFLKAVDRAVVLAKADLRTEAVGEFPELQGIMGHKYAALQGEDADVAAAIEDHYKPQGPTDSLPTNKIAITVALADKLDMLVGFWAIDEKPTGSKDPYALRRAALGVIRILLEKKIKLSLVLLVKRMVFDLPAHVFSEWKEFPEWGVGDFDADKISFAEYFEQTHQASEFGRDGVLYPGSTHQACERVAPDLLSFFHDRLKVYLRDLGARHDIIDAVLTPDADDLLMVARRAEALTAFITSEDGLNLLAGTKRATQLLAAEEKKGTKVAASVDEDLFAEEAEKALFAAISLSSLEASEAVKREDFRAAMEALSKLRAPVDRFFTDVLVNDEDQAIRANRLALLVLIREATATVADFSKIAG